MQLFLWDIYSEQVKREATVGFFSQDYGLCYTYKIRLQYASLQGKNVRKTTNDAHYLYNSSGKLHRYSKALCACILMIVKKPNHKGGPVM